MDLIEIEKNNKDECVISFTNYILLEYDYENLYKLSITGELGQTKLRGFAWKIFMGALPAHVSLEKWIENLLYLRQEYKILSDKMIKQHNYFTEEESKTKNMQIKYTKTKEEQFRRINSFMYKPFREEKEIKKLIELDLSRTFQELTLFHDEKIKTMLAHILFLWNKENSELGYQQGMNDILSIIFLSIYPYYFKNDNKNNFKIENIKDKDKESIIENAENLYLFFHDEDELESELFDGF